LDGGRQAALGTPDQVFTQALFKEVFDVDVIISNHPQGGFPLITPRRQNL
jgi:ABC-type hemin transport system ATPase subunit